MVGATWYMARLATGPTGAFSQNGSFLGEGSGCSSACSYLDQEQPHPVEYHQTRRGNKDDECQPEVREEVCGVSCVYTLFELTPPTHKLVPRQNLDSLSICLVSLLIL